jgi:lysyl-tRNA synthetase class 2
LSRLVSLVGFVSILSAALPSSRARLHTLLELLPRFAPEAANAATIGVGLLLLAVAGGLRRRKRRAWQLATLLASTAVILHVVKGLDVEEAALSAGVLVLLLSTRDAFVGAPDPRSARHTLAVFLGTTSAATCAGLLLLSLNLAQLSGVTGFSTLLGEVLLGLVGLPGPAQFAHAGTAARISPLLAVLGGTVLVSTAATLLRPARGPRTVDASDDARLRDLLARHGASDSLGYFALRHDRSVLFSPTGKAAISYRVLNGVTLAGGDPVGDVEAWPGAIAAWLTEARRHAWVPAVLGASERGAEVYHRFGLDALELGDEAVVRVDLFTLDGRQMRGVRQAVRRLHRAGFHCRIDAFDDLTTAEVAEARNDARRWRGGATERGFSMALGRLGDPADGRCLLVRAFDAQGQLKGLLQLVPWGGDGLSLDLMRRDPDTENGVVELMVADLIAAARARGINRVSLNFAVFRAILERGGRLGAGPVLRLSRRVLLAASRFWQIESLYRANVKYAPTWQPRFLCFPGTRDLPRVTVAALQAEAFLPARIAPSSALMGLSSFIHQHGRRPLNSRGDRHALAAPPARQAAPGSLRRIEAPPRPAAQTARHTA